MLTLIVDGKRFRVDTAQREDGGRKIQVDGKALPVEVIQEPTIDYPVLMVRSGARVLRIAVEEREADSYRIDLNGRPLDVRVEREELAARSRGGSRVLEGPVTVSAPMAGRIVAVKTSVGQTANEGQALVVLEAMKMENEVAAPKKGLVKEIYVRPGISVKAGDPLLVIS